MLARLRFILDRSLTVSNLLDKSVAAYGEDFELLRFSGDLRALGISGQSLTLGALRRVCDRIALALRQQGLQRYDRVAICQSGSVAYLIYSLAIIRAGGITVPVHGNLRSEDLRAYLDHMGVRLVFTDAAHLPRLCPLALAQRRQIALLLGSEVDPATPGVVLLGDVLPATAKAFVPTEIDLDDDVMIVHTSGTTGFPKGVLHGSRSIVLATQGQLSIQPVTRSNRVLLASPANHHITQAAIFSCLAAGLPAYVPAEESAEALLTVIAREHCTLVLAFPDVYQGMCQAGLSRFDLRHVKTWMAGGDSSHEVHIRQLTAHGAMLSVFGKRLLGSMYIEFFGTSEVGFAALMKTSFSFTRRYQRYVGRRTPVSPRVKVADERGRPLPVGVPGRLMVKGPTLFKGYWNAHERLHGVHLGGWWWTGDVAVRTRSGGYYHLDREVDSIAQGEQRFYSLQLEELILKHADVADVAVYEHADSATRVGVLVEPRAGSSLDAGALRQWLQAQYPEHHALHVEVLAHGETLPRGLTGKVLKRQLRERAAVVIAEPVAAAPHSEPSPPAAPAPAATV